VIIVGDSESYLEGFTLSLDSWDGVSATITVDSENTQGQLIVIAYPDGDSNMIIMVQLDGKKIDGVADPASLSQGIVGYYSIEGKEGIQLLVSIDHFSQREISVSFAPGSPEELPDEDVETEDPGEDDIQENEDGKEDDGKDEGEEQIKDGKDEGVEPINDENGEAGEQITDGNDEKEGDTDDTGLDGVSDVDKSGPKDSEDAPPGSTDDTIEGVQKSEQNILAVLIMAVVIILAGAYLYMIRK